MRPVDAETGATAGTAQRRSRRVRGRERLLTRGNCTAARAGRCSAAHRSGVEREQCEPDERGDGAQGRMKALGPHDGPRPNPVPASLYDAQANFRANTEAARAERCAVADLLLSASGDGLATRARGGAGERGGGARGRVVVGERAKDEERAKHGVLQEAGRFAAPAAEGVSREAREEMREGRGVGLWRDVDEGERDEWGGRVARPCEHGAAGVLGAPCVDSWYNFRRRCP